MSQMPMSDFQNAWNKWFMGGRVGPEPRPEEYPDDPTSRDSISQTPTTPLEQMIARDRAAWQAFLQQQAQAHRVPYDPNDLEDVLAQIREPGNAGKDPQEFLNTKANEIRGRSGQPQTPGYSDNTPLPGGAGTGGGYPQGYDNPPPPPPSNQDTSGDQTGDDTGDEKEETDPNPFGSDDPAPTDAAQHAMIERDKGIWESRLRNEARAAGVGYDPSDLEGVLRQLRYAENAGKDPEIFVSQAVDRYRQRAANVPGGGTADTTGQGGTATDPETMGQILAPTAYREGYTYTDPNPRRPTSIIGDFQGTMPGVPQVDPYGPTAPYAAPSPYAAGTYTAPTYTPATPFTMPTAADMAADPGYQFRLQQGQEALERSGAARGVTRTGGTLKDILDYGQRAASQEYGNVYNRMAGQYGMNEALRAEAFDRNAANAWNAWTGNEMGRARAYDVNEANRLAAERQTQQGRLTGYLTGANQQQQDFQNRYRQWTDAYNQWRQQGQDRFREQMALV